MSCHIRTLFLPGFGNDFLKKNTPTDENEAEVEADCLYNHFLKRKNQMVKPEQRIINAMANR